MRRLRLFTKYVALIVALVAGVLLASSAANLWFAYQESKLAITALQREKAVSAAYRIEQYIRAIEHSIGWTTLPRAFEGLSPAEQRRIEFLKLLRQEPAITEVQWMDRAGREQLRVSRLAMDVAASNEDLSKEPRFLEGRKTAYFGPVYFRKETEPYMTISRPAGGQDGGVIAIDVNLKFVWDVVNQIRIGNAGIAYVVDSGGYLIAHPDISLVLQKLNWAALPQIAAARAAAEAPAGERPDPVIERNRAGQEVLTSGAPISTLKWLVVTEVPLSEAFAPLVAEIYRTILLLAIALVLSVFASLALARRMVQPIRALQQGAARIGAGELDQKIEVRTGDELQALGDQFNKMATDLRESYEGLERKVEDRTAELRETLDQQKASAEILSVISGSLSDLTPVFDAILDNALRLCQGNIAVLWRLDGDVLRYAAGKNVSSEASEAMEFLRNALPLGTYNPTPQAVVERRTIHVLDVFAEPDYRPLVPRAVETNRPHAPTVLAVPLVRDADTLGVITVWRYEKRLFTQKQVAMVNTFADQAVIAIENVRLFKEIQEKSRQLEIANKHKSDFLANMSHELRTPLNAIIGFSEVLAEKMFGEVNDKQLEYLKDIHSSGHHLLSLINDILDLSKIEAGRMELDMSEFHLPSTLQNALTLVRERATRHEIKLGLEVDARVGRVHADERKVKQIVLNLLSNAVKFTPDGGRVDVAARMDTDKVLVSVVDTGIGIAAEDQATVFEEFRQVGRDYTKKAEGTGLGLALTKRFVELHGGSLSLASEPGKGSTFTFTLPVEA
jgi:signal transduction histidine kinase